MLLQSSNEACGSRIGVFVCGPESMHKSVASFCKTYSRKISRDGKKPSVSFGFHSLNLSL